MQQQDLFLELGPNCACHADSPVYIRVITETEIIWYEAKSVTRVLDEMPDLEYSGLLIETGSIAKRVPRVAPKTPDTRILPSIQVAQETEPHLLLGTHPHGSQSTVWVPEVMASPFDLASEPMEEKATDDNPSWSTDWSVFDTPLSNTPIDEGRGEGAQA